MDLAGWAAIGGLILTVVTSLAMTVVFAMRTSYKFGTKDQEIANLRERVQQLEANSEKRGAADLAAAGLFAGFTATLKGVEDRLGELTADVKRLLSGDAPPKAVRGPREVARR